MRALNDKVRVVVFAMTILMLSACGGNGGSSNGGSTTPTGGINLQIVSFGDSLSDVGTYAPIASTVVRSSAPAAEADADAQTHRVPGNARSGAAHPATRSGLPLGRPPSPRPGP